MVLVTFQVREERDQLNSLLLNANNYSNKLEEEIDDAQNQIDAIKKVSLFFHHGHFLILGVGS